MSSATHSDKAQDPPAYEPPTEPEPRGPANDQLAPDLEDWDWVDEASWESFPASDPPARWAGRDREPERAPVTPAVNPENIAEGSEHTQIRRLFSSLPRWAQNEAFQKAPARLSGTLRAWAEKLRPSAEPQASASEASEPYDIEEARRQAGQSIKDGAVTTGYSLDLTRALKLLNEALATEIVCVLRYRHHQVVAKGIDFPQVAAEFAEHAEAEQKHAMAIAERIDQLGGNPDFNPATIAPRAVTQYGRTTVLLEMIREDLVAERLVIEIYRRMIGWFGNDDPTTRRMLEEILADEERHANDLASLLARIDPHESVGHPRVTSHEMP
jgi:bacterioferritin